MIEASRRRRDARLLLVGLAFAASAGFLGLHALATPGVLVGPNAGFELATPVGLLVAGVFAAASALEVGSRLADLARPLGGVLLAVLVLWAVLSVAELPPLRDPVASETLDGWQVVLALGGILVYAAAGAGYVGLWRRRRTGVTLAVALAFLLLAEAMLVIVLARNWRLSWWEWHVLMLVAFGAIALAARREWHEERWSGIYLDDTLAGARDVSILVADLAGFTDFSETREPAEVQKMLNAYWNRIVPLLEAQGAHVHQFVGDQVFAHWNARGDQDDHAERAATAALTLQRVAREVERPGWPRFRIGVNSGEVVAGVIGERGHREHGVLGDTVNLASRLESAAPVGEVVIGEETFRRLRGATVEALPDLQVKGKREAVRAYVLRSLGEEER